MKPRSCISAWLPASLLALLLTSIAGLCRADGCDLLPPPSVQVKLLEEKPLVDTHYGYKELTFLGAIAAGSGNYALGLTRGSAAAQFASSTPSASDRSQRWECSSPQLILSLGFKPMTVYIAKEFPAGSCAYNEIYEHEQRHVKAYQEHLAAIAKDLEEALKRRFGEGLWHGPIGQTKVLLQQELNERWLPYIQREIRRVDDTQALIDTPEEYARVADSCEGAIRKLLR